MRKGFINLIIACFIISDVRADKEIHVNNFKEDFDAILMLKSFSSGSEGRLKYEFAIKKIFKGIITNKIIENISMKSIFAKKANVIYIYGYQEKTRREFLAKVDVDGNFHSNQLDVNHDQVILKITDLDNE